MGGEGAFCGVVTGRRAGAGRDGAGAEAGAGFFSMTGGWSVVEWTPVVQGGMDMNSSKVRTRGLQHFQPGGGGLSVRF